MAFEFIFQLGNLDFLGLDTRWHGQGPEKFIFTDGTSSYIGNGSKKTTGLSGRFSNWCDELHLKLTKICLDIRVETSSS